MNARRNPLAKLEAFMQRIVESPFNWLFPSKLEPIEIARKLERAMDDNTMLQGEGRKLAPNVYDIYLSIKDHQQISPNMTSLSRDWQNQLVEFARRRHYTLKTVPILRLHTDTSLRPGALRIEAEQASTGGDGGMMSTMALSPDQLAQIRAQLPSNQPLPGIDAGSSPAHSSGRSGATHGARSGVNHGGAAAPVTPPPAPQAPPMPQAWLTIRLPQAGQQTYRIEKPLVNLGRQLSNDIIVEDKRVSRYHAQIKYQADGQFTIFDLGSTNGITINNTPHMRQHTLRNGDQFTIGSYDFYFERR
ncbi:DUF3662 and FHA domain-containing protein [Dictyobacter arantiisoli]|uniref:FHA domain-containing protein n=1 Tax=Dictyobacter arantiisoli TaxID=2014874 RepID=A0A5A5T6G6_9CHLR|nr:DUF3662 and FHA domain-containing protein [Dictyobacter arantiisoli]GCF07051.1 hypothetical protein KDI_06150 [Dictyobacter arantiisoli]